MHRIIKRRAFTLLELLVVVAIIAVLLAIVIPSLRMAKEQTRTLICRTRLKGIGTAIHVYLDENDQRAFPHGQNLGLGDDAGNEFAWRDPVTGKDIDPRDRRAYWGVAYKTYAQNPDVFGCPLFVHVGKLIYNLEPDLARRAGFALNELFGRDTLQPTLGRKVSDIVSPGRFILAQDHVEPCIEHLSRDMLCNDGPGTLNLTQYRNNGSRSAHYWGIFRHNKKNLAMDNQADAAKRIPMINANPNGLANVLWLDGHADALRETTGDNVPQSSYTGKRD